MSISTSTPTLNPTHTIAGALLVLLVVSATLAASSAQAQEIMVAPRRVVFEGRERSATVALVNQSARARTYRVELIDKRMTERGGLVDVEAGSAEGSARELIRYSPRRVTLAPGGSQTIRLMVRKPAELADGEYRSHLAFIAEAEPDAGTTLEAATAAPGQEGFSSRLIPLYGVSIPVIVRQGTLEVRMAVQGASLQPAESGPPTLDVRLHRDGDRSMHGDLVVTWIEGGDQATVGLLRGVSVYTPNADVAFRLQLKATPGVSLERGTLLITLVDHDKKTPLADYRLQLPPPK